VLDKKINLINKDIQELEDGLDPILDEIIIKQKFLAIAINLMDSEVVSQLLEVNLYALEDRINIIREEIYQLYEEAQIFDDLPKLESLRDRLIVDRTLLIGFFFESKGGGVTVPEEKIVEPEPKKYTLNEKKQIASIQKKFYPYCFKNKIWSLN